ncbi:MAG TPA: ribosome maturation factor RimM [Vicinamibacterales bacterium]|nr:ribosome maturation factor RimM [Vicinamibacterales bacterium]
MDWDDLVLVGRIARAHGIRGEVVIDPETDFPETRFRPGELVYAGPAGGPRPLDIAAVRFHRGRPIVRFAQVSSIGEAERLRGAELRIAPERLTVLPPGAYYRHVLVGCAVRDRGGRDIGVVVGVEATAGGSLLVVRGPAGEILVPFAEEICVRVDPGAREIVVDPPAGLLDLNT